MSDKQSRKTFRTRMEEMIRTLREQIMAGHYAVGEYLPSELDLSRKFQLSNNSVRKGLDTLVEEGLVEKIPRVGNRIKAPSSEDQIVIRLGYYPIIDSQGELPYLLNAFQKRHPHIRVEPIQISDARGYVRDLLTHDMIDMAMMNTYLYQDLLEEQAVELLEPQEPFEEMYPFLKKAFQYKDELYAQPFIFSPVILCYNREHFASLQLPEPDSSWTWDDLIANASKLAIHNERFGFYYHLLSPNRWIVFLLQSGEVFRRDEDGRYRVHETRLLDGIEKVRDILYQPGVYPLLLSASSGEAERLFKEQQVSIIMTTYFSINNLKEADFEFDVAPLPHLNSFNTLNLTIGLAIHKRSKVKSAAKQLVDFLVSDEAQRVIRKETFSIPAHKQAAQWTGQTVYPTRYQMYKEIIPSFSTFTDTGLTLKQLEDMLSECKLYWSGLRTKERLAAGIEAILNQDGTGRYS